MIYLRYDIAPMRDDRCLRHMKTDVLSYFHKVKIYHAAAPYIISRQRYIIFTSKKGRLSETLRKEVVSLSFYPYKTNDTLREDFESVIVGYTL